MDPLLTEILDNESIISSFCSIQKEEGVFDPSPSLNSHSDVNVVEFMVAGRTGV
jgi:hypothetical protein